MINFKWHKFAELSVNQLYKALILRSNVFVVEQKCIYLDPDGKDINALHLLGEVDNSLVAYMRLFPPTQDNNFLVFGRICTLQSTRKNGYGKKLMTELLSYCDKHYPGIKIKCSAQIYLQKFYESYGFKTVSDIYLEDDMPHIAMERI